MKKDKTKTVNIVVNIDCINVNILDENIKSFNAKTPKYPKWVCDPTKSRYSCT